MSLIFSWIKASRLPAQLFIFPALLLGQVFYYSEYGRIDFRASVVIHLYGLFMHFFIVYANDYADFETDLRNQTYTPFSGGSRVAVDGLIKRESLLKAAWLMIIAVMLSAGALSFYQNSWLTVIVALAGLLLLQMYSFPPVCLSYRGFGEVLQVLGVGIVLPVFGYLAQGGQISGFPWMIILLLAPSQLAMAMSTSLPDEPSDRESNKKTSVVLLGSENARVLIIVLYFLVIMFLLFYSFVAVSQEVILLLGLLVMVVLIAERVVSAKGFLIPGSLSLTIFVSTSIVINTFLWFWVSWKIWYL